MEGRGTVAKITRRNLLKKAAVAAPGAVAGGALLSQAAKAAERSPAAGKNLVIFITDQDRAIQNFPKGWEEENLPGVTRLKRNGASFEKAFAAACMCSPSRASMLTGFFPAQHGVKYTLEENMPSPQYPQVELPTNLRNIGTAMTAAGYEVVFKGKWHMSKPSNGSEFTSSDLAPYGFNAWDPPDAGANQNLDQAGGGTTNNDGRFMDQQGSPADGTEGVVDFLTDRAASTQPFCLIVSLVNPHDVLFYPNTYVAGGYDDSWLEGDIGLPPTVDEDMSTKPTAQQDFLKISAGLGVLKTQQEKLNYINFYGNLMKLVDGYLVDVMDTLDSLGLTEETVVVRTADHGELGLSHGGMRQKNFNAYEEGLRVPLVFSNPELFPVPRKSDALVSHVDLLPTLAGLFDVPASGRAQWQGNDYSDLVLGRSDRPVQDYIAFTYDDFQSGQKSPPYVKAPQHLVSVREVRWKITKYYDPKGKVAPQWEMYDLKNDPNERVNLASPKFKRSPGVQSQFDRLKKKLAVVERERLQPLPYMAFRVRSCRLSGNRVVSSMRFPGRGIVEQQVTAELDGKTVVLGKKQRTVVVAGVEPLTVQLDNRELSAVTKSRRSLVVTTRFLPNGGTPVTDSRRLKPSA
jgi:arylsulfatase A-like enzyme